VYRETGVAVTVYNIDISPKTVLTGFGEKPAKIGRILVQNLNFNFCEKKQKPIDFLIYRSIFDRFFI
jgi:hypothetical protein